jgi:predicted enzyme related to lactoylglutathione lyase
MPLTFAQVVFDCHDAAALAGFWSGVLDKPVDPGASRYFATVGRGGDGTGFMFIKVPEPRVGKNRMHVDLVSPDHEAEVDRVIGLGAKHVADFDEHGTRSTTLADPEGNVFDIGAAV